MTPVPWLPYYTYCENVVGLHDFQFLNVVTNLVFFTAAIGLWMSKADIPHKKALTGLFCVAGTASTIWHVSAHQIALLGDMSFVIALTGFIFWIALGELLGWTEKKRIAAVAALALSCFAFKVLTEPFLHESAGAFVPVAAVLAFMAYARKTDIAVSRFLLLAALSLSFAIACRSEDLSVCDFMPAGLHFLWHIASVLTAVLTLAAIGKRERQANSAR